jgi:hypothetical protein
MGGGRSDCSGRRLRVRGAGCGVSPRRRPVRLPPGRLASAPWFPIRLGAVAAHRKRGDRSRGHHVCHLRAAPRRPAGSRARAARDCVDRRPVDRELPRSQAGQPCPERLCRPQGRGSRCADLRWCVCARVSWLVVRGPRDARVQYHRGGVRRGSRANPVRVRRLAERQLHRRRNRQPQTQSSAEPARGHSDRRPDLRVRQRRVSARSRTRRAGDDDNASLEGCRDHVRIGWRPVRHRRDRDLDVRVSRPRHPGAHPRLLRNGCRSRVPPSPRQAAPAISNTLGRHRHSINVVVRTRGDGTVRTASQLRRVCRLDLLRPDRRDRSRLPSHAPIDRAPARHVHSPWVSGDPGRIRRRGRRRCPERCLGRPDERRPRRAAARCGDTGVLLVSVSGLGARGLGSLFLITHS